MKTVRRPILECKILRGFAVGEEGEEKNGGPGDGAEPVGLDEALGGFGIVSMLLEEGVAGDGVEEGDGPGE